MDSKLHVLDSEKIEMSVLRCHLSDITEHLPIKKRRFLFRDSSPPPPANTVAPDGTESVAASQCSSSQKVLSKPDESYPPAASLTVSDLCQTNSIENKVDGLELVNASKKAVEVKNVNDKSSVDKIVRSNSLESGNDLRESSDLVSHDIKSLEPVRTVEFKANSVKLENVCVKENDFSTPIAHPKNIDSSKIDTAIVNDSCSHAFSESECSNVNHVTGIKTLNSAVLDDRLNWDLNTVMDAWEEPLEKYVNTAENVESQVLPVEIKSLTPKFEESELEECKPAIKTMSPVTYIAPRVAVDKTHSLHNLPSPTDSVPCSTHSFEYPVYDMSAKRENIKTKGTDQLSRPTATGTETTEDEKLKLSLVTVATLENGVRQSEITFDEDDKSKVKRVITSDVMAIGNVVSPKFVSETSVDHGMKTVQINENDKVNLSLVTAPSPENGVQSSFVEDDDDDKAKVKRVITSNGISTENSINNRDGKKVIQTTGNSLPVSQLSVLPESDNHPPAAVSSICDAYSDAHVSIKSGKHESPSQHPNDLVRYNHDNFPSDVQTRSEVDNVDELSYGYESQFEDGEFRESSIQTWEGYEGEDREIEHRTDYKRAFDSHRNGTTSDPERLSALQYTTVASQKGTDEISSVLLTEKRESSDHVSGSEPNETGNGTTEVSMKDTSQLDQWKMNVSGSDILPENHASSSRMKDFSSIKYPSRIGRYGPQTEDHETKAEDSRFCTRGRSNRDAFLTRGRFHMQGCSSSNGDDSDSRSVALRSSNRRPPPNGHGGGTFNRSPPFRSSFRRPINEDVTSVDNTTNEVGIDPNLTGQSFRSRLLANREENEFRARLGLRPTGDTSRNRTVNVDRGRSLRYGSQNNGGGPRGRYYGPTNDEPSMKYSRSFDARCRCISGSTSPPVSRTRSPINDAFRRRSRSPNFRPVTRIRRPRSPDYRPSFEANMEPRNDNPSSSSRWVNYKARTTMFDRRSPPPPPIGERLNFYDSSRKSTQNENYRPGRVSVVHGTGRGGQPRHLGNNDESPDNGYRRGGFVRPRYDMVRPVKHGYEPRH